MSTSLKTLKLATANQNKDLQDKNVNSAEQTMLETVRLAAL